MTTAASNIRDFSGAWVYQAQKGAHAVIAARIAGSVSPAVVDELAWLSTLEPTRQGAKVLLVGIDTRIACWNRRAAGPWRTVPRLPLAALSLKEIAGAWTI